jgi:HlyD family secretion protein
MVWMKRGAWILVALAVVYGGYLGVTAYLAGRQQAQSTPYATTTVSKGPVTDDVSDPGAIASATTTNVVAAVGGHVTAVEATVGQVVEAGAVLLQLSDDSGLGADVASAQAALIQAQAQLQADVDPAVNVTQAQIQAAEIQVQQQEQTVQQQERTLAELNVTAPFSGVVTAVAVAPGQTIGGGQGLLTLTDDSQSLAVIQVAESLLPEIAVGGPVSVNILSTGATLAGRITQVGTVPLGTTATASASVQPVTVVLSNPGSGLVAGAAAVATFTPTGPQARNASPFSATGVVAYPLTTTVSAQQAGTLASMVGTGQRVQAGQTLAVLTNAALQSQLDQAQLALQNERDNLSSLQDPEPASSATIEAQQAQVTALEQALALRQQAYANLQVLAPIAGQVTAIDVVPGMAVGQGMAVMTMIDPAALQAQVMVDELNVAQIHVGQAAQVTVAALGGQSLAGRVTAISPVAVVSNGVSTYQVTISIPQVAGMQSGMSVQATIEIASVADAVRVPAEAVQSGNGGSYVLVPDAQGVPTAQAVKTGVVGNVWTQVVSGLQPGQTIIVAVAQTGTTNTTAALRLGGGTPGARPAGGGGGR